MKAFLSFSSAPYGLAISTATCSPFSNCFTASGYQEPYHYYNSDGSTLVSAGTEKINGETYYIFTVSGSARSYISSSGVFYGTLPVGTKLATKGSTTGVENGGYMIFYKKKASGGTWQNLIHGFTYGFVDLGLSVGSTPSKRPVR